MLCQESSRTFQPGGFVGGVDRWCCGEFQDYWKILGRLLNWMVGCCPYDGFEGYQVSKDVVGCTDDDAAVDGIIFTAGKCVSVSWATKMCFLSGIGQKRFMLKSSYGFCRTFREVIGSLVAFDVNIWQRVQFLILFSRTSFSFGNQKWLLNRHLRLFMPGWPPWCAFEKPIYHSAFGNMILLPFRTNSSSEIVISSKTFLHGNSSFIVFGICPYFSHNISWARMGSCWVSLMISDMEMASV